MSEGQQETSITPEAQNFFASWIDKKSAEEKHVITADLFNHSGVVDFDNLTDAFRDAISNNPEQIGTIQEQGRSVLQKIDSYIDFVNSDPKPALADRRAIATEIRTYIDRVFDEITK